MAPAYEQKFNIALARLLREQGLQAEGEVQQPEGRRLDVLVDVDGSSVVLEGEIGNRRGTLGDADARLEQGPELAEQGRPVYQDDADYQDGYRAGLNYQPDISTAW